MDRRHFLRSLGLAGLALPALSNVGRGHAQESPPTPKRLLVWSMANGVHYPDWFPSGNEDSWSLSPCLQPLADFKERMLVLGSPEEPSWPNWERGLIFNCNPDRSLSNGHFLSMVLTGSHLADYDGVRLGSAKSLDQHIADLSDGQTRYRSLELGLRVHGPTAENKYLSYSGPGAPLPTDSNPRSVFDRVFGSLMGGEAGAREQARRRRVHDFLHARFRGLRGRLDGQDRARLDEHVALLRDHEERLRTLPTRMCTAPPRPEPWLYNYHEPAPEELLPVELAAQIDNAVMAFACDLTRVASIQLHASISEFQYRFLTGPDGNPITAGIHAIGHRRDGSIDNEALQSIIVRWQVEQLASLLRKLESTLEPDGTSLLDNTLVLCTNDMGNSNGHGHSAVPWLMFGGLGLRGGTLLVHEAEPHNNVMLAIAKQFGSEIDHIGAPEYTDRVTPGLFR